ncbi:MAG: (Fe-S)-binding protein [Candidatus Helarchaeota archaeon]
MNYISKINKCTECRTCENYCSIFLSTGKYAPHEKLKISKLILLVSEKPENWETIFYCTKCEACDIVCPENIPITKIIDEARYECVKKWGVQFQRQLKLTENIFKTGNPFGSERPRFEWLKNPINKSSKTLLHLGCMISYKYPEMGKNVIAILDELGIDYTISPNERCCGYFIYNTGNHDAALKLIKENKKELKKYKKIITACAGCTIFFKINYGLGNKVHHIIEIVDKSIRNTELKSMDNSSKKAIFHDSCHISRPFDILKQPRNILKKLGYNNENNNFIEFDLTGKFGTCCGADGGMRIVNKDLSLKVGMDRVLEASNKADILFTMCPFCINNFREVAKDNNIKIEY